MAVTVRTSGLRGYEPLMRRLGADPGPLLRRYRIRPSVLRNEDALVPLRAFAALLEASAAITDCPDFGLRLAQGQDISVLGPVAIAMQNAPTVRAAVGYASRFLYVQSPGLVLTLLPDSPIGRDCEELRLEVDLPRASGLRQTVDLSLADLHQMLKALGAGAYRLHAVTLTHAAGAADRSYRRFYGAPVLTQQPHAGLHVARSTLDTPLGKQNAMLREIAVDYLAMTYDAPEVPLSSRVRQALRHAIGTHADNRPEIARLFNLHPRTLQRHLASEGTTFDALREQTRRELALRYLTETHIPLPQLATMLGFSEHSALSRSCRRWFGRSPSALRTQGPSAASRSSTKA